MVCLRSGALSEVVLWSTGVRVSRRRGVSGAVISRKRYCGLQCLGDVVSRERYSLDSNLCPHLSRLKPSLSGSLLNTEQYNGESVFDERACTRVTGDVTAA